MKKIIALLMVCGFAFAFVACGGKTESTEAAATEAVDTTAAPAADTTATDTTAAQ
jgi:raffinose/stachyose/melibiose transport system substrate-binding protein